MAAQRGDGPDAVDGAAGGALARPDDRKAGGLALLAESRPEMRVTALIVLLVLMMGGVGVTGPARRMLRGDGCEATGGHVEGDGAGWE